MLMMLTGLETEERHYKTQNQSVKWGEVHTNIGIEKHFIALNPHHDSVFLIDDGSTGYTGFCGLALMFISFTENTRKFLQNLVIQCERKTDQ